MHVAKAAVENESAAAMAAITTTDLVIAPLSTRDGKLFDMLLQGCRQHPSRLQVAFP